MVRVMRLTGASFLVAIGLLLGAPGIPSAVALPGVDGSDDHHGRRESADHGAGSEADRPSKENDSAQRSSDDAPPSQAGDERQPRRGLVIAGRPVATADLQLRDAVQLPGAVQLPDAVREPIVADGVPAPATQPPGADSATPTSTPTVIEIPVADVIPTIGDGTQTVEPFTQPTLIDLTLVNTPRLSTSVRMPVMSPLLFAEELFEEQELRLPHFLPVEFLPLEPLDTVGPPPTARTPAVFESQTPGADPGDAPSIAGRPAPGNPAAPRPSGFAESVPPGREPRPTGGTGLDVKSQESLRAADTAYTPTASPSELISTALPGLAGILLLTSLGSFIGYRQVRAGASAQGTSISRFMP